jgi:hypothetical protein
MGGHGRPQLGRLIVTPFATIGVLAAVLVWEIEHVGSVVLALVIGGVAIASASRRAVWALASASCAISPSSMAARSTRRATATTRDR